VVEAASHIYKRTQSVGDSARGFGSSDEDSSKVELDALGELGSAEVASLSPPRLAILYREIIESALGHPLLLRQLSVP
jgi:hypothetical protein